MDIGGRQIEHPRALSKGKILCIFRSASDEGRYFYVLSSNNPSSIEIILHFDSRIGNLARAMDFDRIPSLYPYIHLNHETVRHQDYSYRDAEWYPESSRYQQRAKNVGSLWRLATD